MKGETQTLATITIRTTPDVRQAGGDDGDRGDGGERVPQIYDLDVMVIPTNRPIVRDDREDLIFRTKREKLNAIMDEVDRLHSMELPRVGRDDQRGGVRDAVAHAQTPRHGAQRVEREAAQEGIRDRGRGWQAWGGHYRDEHGWARDRHQAWGRRHGTPHRWVGKGQGARCR